MDHGRKTRTHGTERSTIKKQVPIVKREITIDGKPYQVEVNECPIGSPFSVKVNNKILKVILVQEPNSKGFPIKVNGKSYNVEVESTEKNAPFSAKVNNVPFKVELKPAIVTPKIVVATPSLISMQVQKPTQLKGEGVIAAPMAGRVTSIRVKKGDSVKVGSVVCVLEAMKMENEIASPKNGVVEEIRVQEGKAVNEGDILLLIK